MTRGIVTVHEYLDAFSNRDILRLSSLLSPDVMLRDWEQFEQGKANVVAATARIFDSCSIITLNLVNLVGNEIVVIAEIAVSFDNKKSIHIVDVYEFDDDGNIASIRAFKG